MANPFRSLAGILSPKNLVSRIADGLEAFADALASVAEESLPGETPRQRRQRIRDEGRQRRTRRRRTRRPIVPREPEPEPEPQPPPPPLEPEEEPDHGYYVRGEYEEGDEDAGRATYATLAEALVAYVDLNEAGVPTGLLAIAFYPQRRFPYTLIVRKSP